MGCATSLAIFSLLAAVFVSKSAHSFKSSYVVYMGSHSGLLDVTSIHAAHQEVIASATGSKRLAEEALLYSYKHSINGFAALLEPQHAQAISSMPGVISVFPNRAHSLHTTRSWEFLGLEEPSGAVSELSLWKKANYGNDVIVGVLDTGVWPESPSFKDEGLGPIPSRWNGTCETGSNFTAANCNRKLIGARYFLKGFEAEKGILNELATGDFRSPRDKQGHGSHTASTAAGNFVKGANEFGFARGTAKGGAPRARVAVYKVCWSGGCFDADILAAFDAGISDGVDVFSVSVGSSPPLSNYFKDAIAVGSFHAESKGRVVVCSAGNSGPAIASVANVAPWIFTIAASSMDRKFPAPATFSSLRDPNTTTFTGASLSETRLPYAMYPLVSSSDVPSHHANTTASELCFPDSLDHDQVKAKIVACKRGVIARVEKGSVVKDAGGVGMILYNQLSDADEVVADPHVLPVTHVNAADGAAILDFINKTGASALAYIGYPQTVLHAKPSPQMASFSSQGPNSLTPDILKPDITAPGLNVLAAWTGASAPTTASSDQRVVQFNVISGTSMSCPHAAGIVALLRALHPGWSAAAIKSALMTTATFHDDLEQPIVNGSGAPANPFNYGAGHVNPNVASDPGLIYDASTYDYLLFLCSLHYNQSLLANLTSTDFTCPERPASVADLNYPSVTLSWLSGKRTVTRTVTYVGGSLTYRVYVSPPHGVHVEVIPPRLDFRYIGERKTFLLNFQRKRGHRSGRYEFGSLTWTDGTHHVRSPITVHAVDDGHNV